MVLGAHGFGGQIDVTGVATARGPLVFVRVAAETGRHTWAQRMTFLFDIEMATHAIPSAAF